jgi:hypothetical protein
MFKAIHVRKCCVEVPYILSNGAGKEARRKIIKSLSAKLGQAFACFSVHLELFTVSSVS